MAFAHGDQTCWLAKACKTPPPPPPQLFDQVVVLVHFAYLIAYVADSHFQFATGKCYTRMNNILRMLREPHKSSGLGRVTARAA